MIEIVPGSEGDGGAWRDHNTLATFLLYYSRSSQMINLSYTIYRKIDKRSGPKVSGCPRTRIILSLRFSKPKWN